MSQLFCSLVVDTLHGGWEHTLYSCYFWNLPRCAVWPGMWSIWLLFHVTLRIMCDLLLVDEVLRRGQISLTGGGTHANLALTDFPAWLRFIKFRNSSVSLGNSLRLLIWYCLVSALENWPLSILSWPFLFLAVLSFQNSWVSESHITL